MTFTPVSVHSAFSLLAIWEELYVVAFPYSEFTELIEFTCLYWFPLVASSDFHWFSHHVDPNWAKPSACGDKMQAYPAEASCDRTTQIKNATMKASRKQRQSISLKTSISCGTMLPFANFFYDDELESYIAKHQLHPFSRLSSPEWIWVIPVAPVVH